MVPAVLWLAIACSSVPSPTGSGGVEVQPEPSRHDDHATLSHTFDDVERWVTAFDDPSRDAWQRPAAVVEALAIRPGMTVADIGAGTGYFNAWLAAAVGSEGRVIAVDIEPSLVEHMTERAAREGTPQVSPRLGKASDPGLAVGEVDRILIVNTYHHIDRRVAYFRSLRETLRRDGRLVVVDFDKRETPHGPPVGQRLAPETVTAELTAAGWHALGRSEALPEQYLLVFDVLPDEG